ncbi:hypothetical protein ACN47E_003425 [Coniothyrium glycines]
MANPFSFELDDELFGASSNDTQFSAFFERNQLLDFGGAASTPAEPAFHLDDVFGSLDSFELAVAENFSGLQGAGGYADFAKDGAGVGPRGLLYHNFSDTIDSEVQVQDDVYGWPNTNALEQLNDHQDGGHALSPPRQESQVYIGTVDNRTPSPFDTETMSDENSPEKSIEEVAHLKTFVGTEDGVLPADQAPETPCTPKPQGWQLKTPSNTPPQQPRHSMLTPFKPGNKKVPAAVMAILQHKGPFEELWPSYDETHRSMRPRVREIPDTDSVLASASENELEETDDVDSCQAAEPAQYVQELLNAASEACPADEQMAVQDAEAVQCHSPGTQLLKAFSPGSAFSECMQPEASPTPQLSHNNSIYQDGTHFDEDLFTQTFTPDNTIEMPLPHTMTSSLAAMTTTGPNHIYLPKGTIDHNGVMYSPANGASSIPTNGLHVQSTMQPSPGQIMAPSPTPPPARKTRAPAKPRAPTKSRRPTGAATSKVTKSKATHKRHVSAPARVAASSAPAPAFRSLAELHSAPFTTLTHEERCRLLLPLLQGVDPKTGRRIAAPGRLADTTNYEAIGASCFPGHEQTHIQNVAPMANIVHTPIAKRRANMLAAAAATAATPPPQDMAMAQQAVQELGGDAGIALGAASRQSAALQRAAMLRAEGRRR